MKASEKRFLSSILICRNELGFVSLTSYHGPHINRKANVRWPPSQAAKDCAVDQDRLRPHCLSVRNGAFSNGLTEVSQVVEAPKTNK